MINVTERSNLIEATAADRLPFAVACINSQALNSFCCTASMLGAEKVIIFGWDRTGDKENIPSYKYYIPIERVYNTKNEVVTKEVFYHIMQFLKYFPVFIEQGGSKDISQISEIKKYTIIMVLNLVLFLVGAAAARNGIIKAYQKN